MTKLLKAAIAAESLLAHGMAQIDEGETWCKLPASSVIRVLEDLRAAMPPSAEGRTPDTFA